MWSNGVKSQPLKKDESHAHLATRVVETYGPIETRLKAFLSVLVVIGVVLAELFLPSFLS